MSVLTNDSAALTPHRGLPPSLHLPTVLCMVAGLLALFIPTYVTLSQEVWNLDIYSHGPLILGVCLWLLWHDRMSIFEGPAQPDLLLGSLTMAAGLVLHIAGHSQSINMLMTAAQPVVFAAVMLLLHGRQSVKRAWFPLFFMVFMIPLPEVVVQGITMPLKHAVSVVAEAVLYHLGYPVGRAGVTLTIGPYQLLVADACSGMNSLLTLESLGLLYMRMMDYHSKARNTVLALSIIPTSFVANVVRVLILVLVTYYYGDSVGQGFVHKFSGMVLFAVSLVSIYFIDQALGLVFRAPEHRARRGR